MSKRKGLSVDDKRRVVLGVYHDKKEPFNLKEIETIASKLGVVQQTVKEINQSLIDDFLVLSDKIGAANFFWSFPSKAFQDQIVQKEQLQLQLFQSESNIVSIRQSVVQAKETRSAPGREESMRKLEALRAKEKELDGTLEVMKFNDPAEILRIKKQVKANIESVNRWTDNVWTVKAYLTKRKGMAGKEADKVLGIDGSFDYIEDNEELYLGPGYGSNKKQKK